MKKIVILILTICFIGCSSGSSSSGGSNTTPVPPVDNDSSVGIPPVKNDWEIIDGGKEAEKRGNYVYYDDTRYAIHDTSDDLHNKGMLVIDTGDGLSAEYNYVQLTDDTFRIKDNDGNEKYMRLNHDGILVEVDYGDNDVPTPPYPSSEEASSNSVSSPDMSSLRRELDKTNDRIDKAIAMGAATAHSVGGLHLEEVGDIAIGAGIGHSGSAQAVSVSLGSLVTDNLKVSGSFTTDDEWDETSVGAGISYRFKNKN